MSVLILILLYMASLSQAAGVTFNLTLLDFPPTERNLLQNLVKYLRGFNASGSNVIPCQSLEKALDNIIPPPEDFGVNGTNYLFCVKLNPTQYTIKRLIISPQPSFIDGETGGGTPTEESKKRQSGLLPAPNFNFVAFSNMESLIIFRTNTLQILGLPKSLTVLVLVQNDKAMDVSRLLSYAPGLRIFYSSAFSLTGNLTTGLEKLQQPLESLFLEERAITGTIPARLGNIRLLALIGTGLSGTLPPLGNRIESIVLKSNQLLSGTLPTITSALKHLTITQNRFSGKLNLIGSFQNLTYVDMSDNAFSGTFPLFVDGFSKNTSLLKLRTIKIGQNAFSGTLPTDLFLHRNLMIGEFQNNKFSGIVPLPPNVRPKNQTFDLSFNQLIGNLTNIFPFCINVKGNRIGLLSSDVVGDGQWFPNLVDSYLSPSPNNASYSFSRYKLATSCQKEFFPQEIDECNMSKAPFVCPNSSTCVDGWEPISVGLENPLYSFTCECHRGYKTSNGLSRFEFNPRIRCLPVCGDNIWVPEEDCEIGPDFTRVGCGSHCSRLEGWTCSKGNCSSICGDGIRVGSEECDPNNQHIGCQSCKVVEGWTCDLNTCQDMNECTLKLSENRRSLNGKSCPKSSCVNTLGGFYCCDDGYFNPDPSNDGNLTSCQDIDECRGDSGLSNGGCSFEKREYCKNLPGTFTCLPCSDPFNVIQDENPQQHEYFKSLSGYNHSFLFHSCFGACSAGFHTFTYTPQASFCSTYKIEKETLFCQFPCTDLESLTTAEAAITSLSKEFQRKSNGVTFLEDIFAKIFNVTISFQNTSKRAANQPLQFTVSPCSPNDVQPMNDLLYNLASEIVPNAPGLAVQLSSNCDVSIGASNPTPVFIPIIAALCSTFFVLIVLLIYYLYRDDLKYLPTDVAWSYQQYKRSVFRWSYQGSSESGYYYKRLDKDTEFYHKAMKVYSSLSNTEGFQIRSITAVFNPVLVRNFIGSYRIALSRSGEKVFTTKKWRNITNALQDFVYDQFQRMSEKYSWNHDESSTYIVPMLHGTDLLIAQKICENGFAALSSLDAGYYGKGIYFTSHGHYTIPYIVSRSEPALILSWVLPGNTYPVTEDHKGPKSLLGMPIKSGYSSHYVLTKKDGSVITGLDDQHYDEMVVAQEAQIAPAFVIHLESDNLPNLFFSFNRTLPNSGKVLSNTNTPKVNDDGLLSLQSLDEESTV